MVFIPSQHLSKLSRKCLLLILRSRLLTMGIMSPTTCFSFIYRIFLPNSSYLVPIIATEIKATSLDAPLALEIECSSGDCLVRIPSLQPLFLRCSPRRMLPFSASYLKDLNLAPFLHNIVTSWFESRTSVDLDPLHESPVKLTLMLGVELFFSMRNH